MHSLLLSAKRKSQSGPKSALHLHSIWIYLVDSMMLRPTALSLRSNLRCLVEGLFLPTFATTACPPYALQTCRIYPNIMTTERTKKNRKKQVDRGKNPNLLLTDTSWHTLFVFFPSTGLRWGFLVDPSLRSQPRPLSAPKWLGPVAWLGHKRILKVEFGKSTQNW